MARPVIFTLTGPSCAGKSTLEKIMVEKLGFANLVSETTRARRPTDVDGENYHFRTVEKFKEMRDSGALIEHIEFNGDFYGMSKAEADRVTAMGKSIVVVVEPNGRDQIREYAVNNDMQCISIYVGGNTVAIADRFIWRTIAQFDAIPCGGNHDDFVTSASIRLSGMLTKERAWQAEAHCPYNNPYTMIIERFDENTQEKVLHDINLINENQYSYPKREMGHTSCPKLS